MAATSDYGIIRSDEGSEISISYHDYRKETLEWMEARDLQGGGHTWEALAQAALELVDSPALSQIEFSSEGDAFFAWVQTKEAADVLEAALERLSSDPSYRLECIARAESEGYLE